MRRLGMHIDLTQAAMNDLNANIHRIEIITATNASMGTLAGKFPIAMLSRKITITSDTDGVFLPTNLAGINTIRETDTGREVWRRGEGGALTDEEIYRYYTDIDTTAESETGLPFVGEGAIAAGGSEVTCAELVTLSATETLSGLTLVISDDDYGDYHYEIDAVTAGGVTIKGNHPYMETAAVIRVRPNLTQRLFIVDNSEEIVTGDSYTVYYWIYPNPLSLDSDIIPLVYPDILELMTIRRIPETKDRRPVSKTEIEEAMKVAQAAEPIQGVPARPLDEQGNIFTMNPDINRIPYKMRGE